MGFFGSVCWGCIVVINKNETGIKIDPMDGQRFGFYVLLEQMGFKKGEGFFFHEDLSFWLHIDREFEEVTKERRSSIDNIGIRNLYFSQVMTAIMEVSHALGIASELDESIYYSYIDWKNNKDIIERVLKAGV